MAQDTIKDIRNAEKQARKTVADAEAEKLAILDKAKAEGDAYAAELIGAATDAAGKALAAVEDTLAGELEAAGQRAEADIDAFHRQALDKRDEAIELVISEIA